MSTTFRLTMAAFMAAGAVALVGCQSSSKSASSDHALVCPKCETVWVAEKKVFSGPREVHRLQYKPAMSCPTCDKTAKAYFEGGGMALHECPDCKAAPRVYKPHPIDHAGHKHQ